MSARASGEIRWAVAGDTSTLPTVSFGRRSLLWWGTLGYAVIEGWTLALSAATYLYIRGYSMRWPPAATPLPGLGSSTATVCLMLASLVPMWWTDKGARRLDRTRVRVGLTVTAILGFMFLLSRALEFANLNVSWQDGAYGSAVWTTLGLHTSLIVIELAELLGATIILWRGRVGVRMYSDTADIAVYWYFLVLAWVPLYAMIYLFPRA